MSQSTQQLSACAIIAVGALAAPALAGLEIAQTQPYSFPRGPGMQLVSFDQFDDAIVIKLMREISVLPGLYD